MSPPPPPPQWLLAADPNFTIEDDSDMLESRKKENIGRTARQCVQFLSLAFLWACFFVSERRSLDFSDYLDFLTDGVVETAGRVLETTDAYDDPTRKNFEATLIQEDQFIYLNDPSIRLSPRVHRPWLAYHNSLAEDVNNTERLPVKKPKRKLVLTDYGWNNPDGKGLSRFPRSLRLRELLQAFIDHPDFDPTFAWHDVMTGKAPIDEALEYVVFMDIETCFESNYPHTVGEFEKNADTLHNRIVKDKMDNPCIGIGRCFPYIKSILTSPLFQAVNASTMLYWDCRGNGPEQRFRREIKSHQISIVSISSGPGTLLDEADMGMPPPAPHPVRLSKAQRQAIVTCDSETPRYRPHLFTFLGRDRPASPRKKLFRLHNGKDVLVWDVPVYEEERKLGQTNETFQTLLEGALFAAAPRGDNRFSYRFSEVMSSGAIPVVHSDGWILPFHKTLVDWRRCAVVIPEAQMDQTVDILRKIDPAQRCRMRQYCYDIYQKYMVNPDANIEGILSSVESARANTSWTR